MRTHLRVTAAALVFVGVAAGCSRTTEGTVAMTTEPGPPISAPTRTPPTSDPGFPGIPGLPSIPGLPDIPGFPMPGNTNVPEVPAPANSDTMKCSEFIKLDEATQRAVIKAIIEKDGPQGGGPEQEMVAAIMASAMCSFLPSAVVKEVVLGGSPP
ncbi:hypothetical protein [Mycolicibacterium sp. 120270]|uniref:hypothetical protein n=1 Tax=Mycolicibacterium sp. 120270 TaxID=3090600 RepID=UPI00299DB6FE|nr:hypothetical protein [Mycolicibacterium sp. 120270]MDX1882286.1 hypothetical protein [Mycolicibacterium sp. 120270]